MLSRRSIELARPGCKPRTAAAVSETTALREDPAPGTHLVTSRRGYMHHGIYIGGGMVVHYSGFSRFLHSGPVEEVTLSRFSMGRAVGIVEHSESYSPQEIVLRARSRLGENKYHVLRNNCEHFCNWCISGRSRSMQVERPLAFKRALVMAVHRMVIQCTKPLLPGNLMAGGVAPVGRQHPGTLCHTAILQS